MKVVINKRYVYSEKISTFLRLFPINKKVVGSSESELDQAKDNNHHIQISVVCIPEDHYPSSQITNLLIKCSTHLKPFSGFYVFLYSSFFLYYFF